MADVLHLIIPGIDGSGPDHWQSRWIDRRADCIRVELGDWEGPDPDRWIGRLHDAVSDAGDHDVVLVAHSLGCLLVGWWAGTVGKVPAHVRAAMLVAPCDPEGSHDPRLWKYRSLPANPLPFPAMVVASSNDLYSTIARSCEFADRIRAELIDVGPQGHINASSRLGDWRVGQNLLESFEEKLLARHR